MVRRGGPYQIITFYSYKGGTGRSMALANVAWILASNGHRVLVIDWDLEAPGLHRYFQPFIVDADLVETDGLIDYMWSTTNAIMSAPETERSSDRTLPNLLDYRLRVDWPFDGKGYIDFIPAGRQGDNYPQRVNGFDWENFYERLGGGRVLNAVRQQLREAYNYVLIDSRTGVSDTSGICTVQMPDAVVGLFTLNNQSIEGVAAVLESAIALRAEGREGPLTVFPVMSRVEDGEQHKLEASRIRAREVFSRFLPETARGAVREYWDDVEIPYKKFYAYEEVLATFGDEAGALGSRSSLLNAIERLTRRVTGIDRIAMPEVDRAIRQEILSKYANPDAPTKERDEPAPVAKDAGKPPPSELAELLGVGRRGIRWRQVAVLVIGTWLADILRMLIGGGLSVESALVWAGGAALFVFAAITAVRYMRRGLAVVLLTGTVYSVGGIAITLVPGIHYYSRIYYGLGPGLGISSAIAFAFAALRMIALQFAVSGPLRWIREPLSVVAESVSHNPITSGLQRERVNAETRPRTALGGPTLWTRMATGLFVAQLAGSYVAQVIIYQSWDPGRLFSVYQLWSIGDAILWTLTFWIGLTKFGRDDAQATPLERPA